MNSNRKTAIIVGVLFITLMVTWTIGYTLIESILSAPDYLKTVSANETKVIIGVLFEFLNCFAVVGIAVMLFPILKQHNESIALGYVGFRIIEATILVVGLISPLALITFSREYVMAGATDATGFQTLGTLAIEWRFRSGQMVPIFVGSGGLMLCYLLYQSKLIPRFISVWGLIGYASLLTGAILVIFGLIDIDGAGMIAFLPGSIFELLLLPIWLFAKGFNTSAIDSMTAKTAN